MRTTVLHNCQLVDGQNTGIQSNIDIIVVGSMIREISPTRTAETYSGVDEIISVDGHLVMPGLINNHTHGTAFGPLFPSGHEALPHSQILQNLDTHLQEGTTTVLCVDGFVTADALAETNQSHPLQVGLASCNTPACLEAATLADGGGLTDENIAFSATDAIGAGAVALGEIGAGHTLGGGGASYMYIPMEVRRRTGITITSKQADKLKIAVLGRHISTSSFDHDAVEESIVDANLAGKLSVDEAKEIVSDIVLPAFDIALYGLTEAAGQAQQSGVPVLVHNAAASMTQVADIARREVTLIAGHSNHNSFDLREGLEHAERLKEHGVIVDVSTLDTFGAQLITSGPDLLFAMFDQGLVDTISTDYAGGHHDSMLLVIDRAVKAGVVSLPDAIAMASANVADAIPGLAPNRGRVVPGSCADMVITRADALDDVQAVIVNGTVEVRNGKRVAPAA